MRSMLFAAYFMALGWYVRATGLDEEIGEILLDSYRHAVGYTARIVREENRRQLEAVS